MEIEKIINNLKTHMHALQGRPCETCEFYHAADCENKLLQSAISAMEVFIPRIISYEEAILSGESSPVMFCIEFFGDSIVEPAFVQVATDKGAYIITPMGSVSIKRSQDGKMYRLWNVMPSSDLVQLTKWRDINA